MGERIATRVCSFQRGSLPSRLLGTFFLLRGAHRVRREALDALFARML